MWRHFLSVLRVGSGLVRKLMHCSFSIKICSSTAITMNQTFELLKNWLNQWDIFFLTFINHFYSNEFKMEYMALMLLNLPSQQGKAGKVERTWLDQGNKVSFMSNRKRKHQPLTPSCLAPSAISENLNPSGSVSEWRAWGFRKEDKNIFACQDWWWYSIVLLPEKIPGSRMNWRR